MSYFVGTMANTFIGGNQEQPGSDISSLAKRFKDESKRLNGHETIVRRTKVDKYRPLPLR